MPYDCYCDYEPAEFYSTRRVKSARKQHQCIECRRTIKPGEGYDSTSGKWDGHFETFLWCTNCAELCEWARISVPCFCFCYGNLHEDLKEMVREVARETPGFFMEYGRRIIRLRRAGGCI